MKQYNMKKIERQIEECSTWNKFVVENRRRVIIEMQRQADELGAVRGKDRPYQADLMKAHWGPRTWIDCRLPNGQVLPVPIN